MRTNITLNDDIYKKLKKHSEDTGVSMASIIGLLLFNYLNNNNIILNKPTIKEEQPTTEQPTKRYYELFANRIPEEEKFIIKDFVDKYLTPEQESILIKKMTEYENNVKKNIPSFKDTYNFTIGQDEKGMYDYTCHLNLIIYSLGLNKKDIPLEIDNEIQRLILELNNISPDVD